MKKVFLGGTCGDSHWRDTLIPLLRIDYFNPVVDDWNEEAYERELFERETSDVCLYAITPKMTGLYSVAEVVDDSNKRPDKTIMVLLVEDDGAIFTEHQAKALRRVGAMVEGNGAAYCETLEEAARLLNADCSPKEGGGR